MTMKYNWLENKNVLRDVIELRKDGYEYRDIQKWLKEQHQVIASTDMIRSAFNRHSAFYPNFMDENPNNLKQKPVTKVTTMRKPIKKEPTVTLLNMKDNTVSFKIDNAKVERIIATIEVTPE